jgi:hypothetical protein
MVLPREKRKSGRKRWKSAEAKLLQTAASLRTFFVLVMFVETLESPVAFSGYARALDTKISTKIPYSMRVFAGDSFVNISISP